MRHELVVLASLLLVAGLIAPVASAHAGESHEDSLACEFPYTAVDATGTEVTLEEPPDRVVTTNPSAAQIMWEIGADEKVVGLTQFALYLEGADERTLISGEERFVVTETVVDLEPDLVLAPNATQPETIAQLREAGLTVYHFPLQEDLDDVFAKVAQIGELTGECDGAEETMTWMDERLQIVEDAIEGQERPGAMYMFFDFTAGEGTFIHEIIEAAGAENLAASAGVEGYQQISEEVVIEEDPDWIILNSDDPALPESEAVNETTAAQTDQVVVVQIEHLNQPGPRNVLAIETLVEHFHPEAYEEAKQAAQAEEEKANETEEASEETDESDDAEEDAEDTTAETDDGDAEALPGFGPIVALVGLLVASRVWRGQ